MAAPMPTTGRRSYERSAPMLLRMSPALLRRLDAAAAASGRTRTRYLLEILDRTLPPELGEGQEQREGGRMAS